MELVKRNTKLLLSIILIALGVLMSPITSINVKAEDVSKWNITLEAKYVNQYTPAKKLCGYLKDESGEPVVDRTIYIAKYDDWSYLPHGQEAIDNIYTTVKTDKDGYYSTWAYNSGYYVATLSYTESIIKATTYAYVRA